MSSHIHICSKKAIVSFLFVLNCLFPLMAHGQTRIEVCMPDTAGLYSTISIDMRISTPGYDEYLEAESSNSSIIEARTPASSAPNRGAGSSYSIHFRYKIKAHGAGSISFHGPRLVFRNDTIETVEKDIVILPDEGRDNQKSKARDFLKRKYSFGECNLVLEAENASWSLWRDYQNGAFAIIDTDSCQVLGYGHDRPDRRIGKIGNIPFLGFYSSTKFPAVGCGNSSANTKNLLSTSWGQGFPYNSRCPVDRKTGQKSLLGCGAICLGQILHHLDIPGWDDTVIQNNNLLYKKLYQLSRELDSEFSSSGTSSNINRIIQVMKDSYNIAHGSSLRRSPDYDTTLRIIIHDLNNGIPLIGVSSSHAYIIDGIDHDYIHVIMGWDGLYDGYFRLFPDKDGKCMIDAIIYNIMGTS